MNQSESNILEVVLSELKSIRTGLPNGELKQIIENQKEMKEDISDLKENLLDPNDGVIVKVNKNTEFRTKSEVNYEKYNKYFQELEDLKSWKSTVIKVLWLLFGSIVTIITRIFIGIES